MDVLSSAGTPRETAFNPIEARVEVLAHCGEQWTRSDTSGAMPEVAVPTVHLT